MRCDTMLFLSLPSRRAAGSTAVNPVVQKALEKAGIIKKKTATAMTTTTTSTSTSMTTGAAPAPVSVSSQVPVLRVDAQGREVDEHGRVIDNKGRGVVSNSSSIAFAFGIDSLSLSLFPWTGRSDEHSESEC